MRYLYYYNPEVDLAMAWDKPNYTAPRNIAMMQRRYALLPALYAEPGSILLLPDGMDMDAAKDLLHYPTAESKGLQIVTFDELASLDFADIEIRPWGWSRSLRHKLLKHGVPKQALPSQEYLDNVRDLCHRRTTIAANSHSAFDTIRNLMPTLPVEFIDTETAMGWADTHDNVFFKAPWSSSGHGVFHLSRSDTPAEFFESRRKLLCEWLNGTIARQGSALAETGIRKILDCATEWMINSPHDVRFMGWSVFQADDNGHYLGNIKLPQTELKRLITEAICQSCNGLASVEASNLLHEIISAQQQMLTDLIAPGYSGPTGIDMIIGEESVIAPCIEINLRMTQGLVMVYNEQNNR